MSTSNDPRARHQRLYSAAESALQTPATTGFVRRAFYEYRPNVQSTPQDDQVIGADYQNTLDDTPGAPDMERGSVAISWPLDLIQIGYVLTELFGAPVTTGTTPKAHTFSSGASVTVPSRTIERLLKAEAYDGAQGLVLRSLRFPIGPDRGYTQVNATYLTRKQLGQYGSTIIADDPEDIVEPSLANRVPRAVGTIKLDGVAMGSILSGDFTIENILGEDSYHGSALIDDVQVEGRRCALNINARFKGSAIRDLGEVAPGEYIQGDYEIELAWQLTSNMKLVITIGAMRFAKTGVAASGVGRLDVPLQGRGEVGASTAMITAVLTNSHATYA